MHIKNNFVGNIERGVKRMKPWCHCSLWIAFQNYLLYSGDTFEIHFICFITEKYKTTGIF